MHKLIIVKLQKTLCKFIGLGPNFQNLYHKLFLIGQHKIGSTFLELSFAITAQNSVGLSNTRRIPQFHLMHSPRTSTTSPSPATLMGTLNQIIKLSSKVVRTDPKIIILLLLPRNEIRCPFLDIPCKCISRQSEDI